MGTPVVPGQVLDQGITLLNGKGGTGKTSLTANLAGLYAEADYKVLAVDLDPQGRGNLGADLGYNARGLSDAGRSMGITLAFGGTPDVIRDVRPNLDVIAGGREMKAAVAHLMQQGPAAHTRLRDVLAPIVAEAGYDMVLIDTPPNIATLQEIALATTRHALIPTRSDAASIEEGVEQVADAFMAVRAGANPDLALLGAVVVATSFRGQQAKTGPNGEAILTKPTRRHEDVRSRIEAILGVAAPVFRSYIRYAEAPAVDARGGGQLAHELEREALTGPKWYEVRRNPELKAKVLAAPESASGLASDYQRVAEELLDALEARRPQEAAADV